MRVLLVIHGYPPRYNAGSEVYTQTLAHGLRKAGVQVAVVCREEDPFVPDYRVSPETDPANASIPVYVINHARSNARFRNAHIEKAFEGILEMVSPDLVHIGHLSHLSTGLVETAKSAGLPVVFTVHDYWLMCPRGQFLQWGLTSECPWKLCEGQDDLKCAQTCFNRFVTGLELDGEVEYWTGWARSRMQHIHRMCEMVDMFLVPSRRLMERHIREFGIDGIRAKYVDYGFDRSRLFGRNRKCGEPFTFGYIGRHHPSKGVDHLLQAFSGLNGRRQLRIWGRPEGHLTSSLRRMAAQSTDLEAQVEWRPEYRNESIVPDVLNLCDCIVVPSIWDENSPLVIHEAQQARVPVITADHGGMGEYVRDRVNGLTFRHRDCASLGHAMQEAMDDPEAMIRLGNVGYLYSEDGNVPSVDDHVRVVLDSYRALLP